LKPAGLVEEDETEQLKASVDYLVELCETVSPVSMLHYFLAFFFDQFVIQIIHFVVEFIKMLMLLHRM
jgi:hypothetical protein